MRRDRGIWIMYDGPWVAGRLHGPQNKRKLLSKEGDVFKLVVQFEKQILTMRTQSGTDWHTQCA